MQECRSFNYRIFSAPPPVHQLWHIWFPTLCDLVTLFDLRSLDHEMESRVAHAIENMYTSHSNFV